ncbi:MAG TPA: glycosyltransferase family 2 protein, partial [Hyphomonadaceae bacterium]|nr:glycosyltransferase family 2 protein [Hyphomonadaceae bacterium]
MLKIDIVCPVFREEASIEAFHRALIAATTPLEPEHQFRYIYVVDPSPPDRSADILRGLADRVDNITVIEMSRRFGHQAAIIAGLDASTGDAVVMLDSDLQHPPSLIPTLIDQWRNGAEIVQTLRQDDAKISFGKRVTSRMFYGLFEKVTKIDLNAGSADFRLLSRKVVDVFRNEIREHNPFFRGLITWVGYRIAYVPFTPERRFAGRSNYSLAGLMAFAVNGLCSFSKLPLRLCIWLGLLMGLGSLIFGITALMIYFFVDTVAVPGWASVIGLLSFTAGLNLFFLGVLGE